MKRTQKSGTRSYRQKCLLKRILNQERAGAYEGGGKGSRPPDAPWEGARRGAYLILHLEICWKKNLGFFILEAELLKLFIIFFNSFCKFFFITSKFTNLQSSLINKESIKRFNATSDIISILIHNHNNILQSFVWSSIALNSHVSHFEDWLFSFVIFSQKWLIYFNCFRNDGEMKISKVHRRLTWNYSCIPFKYTSYKKEN